ncbi:hypothetical protein BKA70DRAFT_1217863 [Coprinopsis sp. MPI-PUGE-AT-0042]|nr:hypothetical protein BKA70DRAFT_1217863 [Coprinopsis sp. MPI-PUGE-AT-0042]
MNPQEPNMPNKATSLTVTSVVQPDKTQHRIQPIVPTNSNTFQSTIDLSPYVSAPEHQLIGKDNRNQEGAQDTTPTSSLTASWSTFTRTINLSTLLCHVRSQSTRDPEDEQIEMRTHQDAEEREMEERGRGKEVGLSTQPTTGQSMRMKRSSRATETWTINFEMPPPDQARRRKKEKKREGIIASVFKRDRTEVVFRIEEAHTGNPELTVYLSAPIRTTKLWRKEGFLNRMATNLLYKERALRDPMEKVREDAREKRIRDEIEANRRLQEAINTQTRARKAEKGRKATARKGKAKMEYDGAKPNQNDTSKTPNASRISERGVVPEDKPTDAGCDRDQNQRQGEGRPKDRLEALDRNRVGRRKDGKLEGTEERP